MPSIPPLQVHLSHPLPPDDEVRPAREETAICMSGGGYRAMLFHLGSLWRLNEGGYLQKINRFSSVSGGSITSALLGLRWNELAFDANGVGQAFIDQVATPIRIMASQNIDIGSVLTGFADSRGPAGRVAKAYQKYLFHDATLQDLPDAVEFSINATNVQTGAAWEFTKAYMGDYLVGDIKNPTLLLADAVAASSAFPPVLSPMRIALNPSDFADGTGQGDTAGDAYRTMIYLADGGVYDNMGIEPVWKSFRQVLVSDAGAKMRPESHPATDWALHSVRVYDITDNQVRSLRKRQVVGTFAQTEEYLQHGGGLTDNPYNRLGTYWGIRTDYTHYANASQTLSCPLQSTMQLAAVATRLDEFPNDLQERLINWGYAVTDAAMRTHVDPNWPSPVGFPYPRGV